MVNIEPYSNMIPEIKDKDDLIKVFFDHLITTNRTADFFVDWEKVRNHVKKHENGVQLLEGLIYNDDKRKKCEELLTNYSKEILPVIPLILAIRDKKIKIIMDLAAEEIVYENLSFSSRELTAEEIGKYVTFCEKSGIFKLFDEIKNLRDYLLGVEVGMDTNARKNRSGKIMEEFVEGYIKNLVEGHKSLNIKYIPQATKDKIKEKFNMEIQLSKTDKRFDFAIKKDNTLYLIEVNFYSTGGSKLKATAGEYVEVGLQLKNQNIVYIWITDGKGWETAKNPIKEAFDELDYILNIYFLKKGILEAILNIQ